VGRFVFDEAGLARCRARAGYLAVMGVLFDAERAAVRIVPVDTHLLQSTIDSAWYGPIPGGHGRLFTDSGYGAYVDRGTRNADGTVRTRAQPFMMPAFGLPPGSGV
jgi:hypothetical protein